VLLTIDVGNTQTHVGAFNGPELVEHWRFATVAESTADQLGAALADLLALRGLSLVDTGASIVSSTVPQLVPEWEHVAERYLGHEILVVGPGVKTGIAIRMENPRELGADRLVNAVAASASGAPAPNAPPCATCGCAFEEHEPGGGCRCRRRPGAARRRRDRGCPHGRP
jgi:pantothenate kinase type III